MKSKLLQIVVGGQIVVLRTECGVLSLIGNW
jgi:hypothetical protein